MSYSALASRGFGTPILLFVSLSLAAPGCRHTRGMASLDPAAEEEEVNVGYGTLNRSDVAGAISSLDETELARGGGGRMEDVLQSRLPGVRVTRLPSGEISLQIRGVHSFQGDDEPLVLIDGTPLRTADLDQINAYDIHRVDILRDVASTAIYGVRGANGVILITTRRPR